MPRVGGLVHVGCCNKASQTEWLVSNIKIILHISAGWNSEIRVPASSGAGESPVLGCRLLSSYCNLTWGKQRGGLCGLFWKGANPLHECPSLMTQLAPQGAPANVIALVVKISTTEFGGTQTSSPLVIAVGQCEHVVALEALDLEIHSGSLPRSLPGARGKFESSGEDQAGRAGLEAESCYSTRKA